MIQTILAYFTYILMERNARIIMEGLDELTTMLGSSME
jgi:hypothetical protein